MATTEYPLVSCICIPGRKLKLLERSIHCFFGQTYENKELIIIYEKKNIETEKFIKFYNHPQIIFLESQECTSLDSKIHLGVNEANGTYCCLWAGEDWHHGARLEYQYQAVLIKEVVGTVLSYFLLSIEKKSYLYVSSKRLWAESIFLKKSEFLCANNEIPLVDIIEKVARKQQLYYIVDVPNLYVYSYYDNRELIGDDDWNEIFNYSCKLSPKDSKIAYSILQSNEKKDLEKTSEALDKILGNPIFEEEEKDSNTLNDKIPKIIHLTYKTKIIPELYKKTFQSITSLHPNWEIRIYDDEEAEKIVGENFPELLKIYKAYPSYIQRVDVFRIAVVYLFGGFYLDLDLHCFKSLDELCNSGLVLGEEIRYSAIKREILRFKFDCEVQVGNFIFGSVVKHPFWIDLLMEIIKRSSYIINYEVDVLESTGPGVLSEVYKKNKHKYKDITLVQNKFKRCHSGCPCVSCHFGDFAAHLHVNGWTWSGKPENIKHTLKHEKLEDKVRIKAYSIMEKRRIN